MPHAAAPHELARAIESTGPAGARPQSPGMLEVVTIPAARSSPAAAPARRRSRESCAVGRGHASLLTDLDTLHSKLFRDIGHLLVCSLHSFRDLYRHTASPSAPAPRPGGWATGTSGTKRSRTWQGRLAQGADMIGTPARVLFANPYWVVVLTKFPTQPDPVTWLRPVLGSRSA